MVDDCFVLGKLARVVWDQRVESSVLSAPTNIESVENHIRQHSSYFPKSFSGLYKTLTTHIQLLMKHLIIKNEKIIAYKKINSDKLKNMFTERGWILSLSTHIPRYILMQSA